MCRLPTFPVIYELLFKCWADQAAKSNQESKDSYDGCEVEEDKEDLIKYVHL